MLKALAFRTVARIPRVYEMLQKRATGRYFYNITDESFAACQAHLTYFEGGTALEFGAGSNLLCPLLLSHAGATTVYAYDIDRLATVEQVNHVVLQLETRLGGSSWPLISNVGDDLVRKYRIRYVAPGDARATGLEDGSVDFIYSTSTLEHIPEGEIRTILKELERIASPRAVLSSIIDYHDHYSTGDRGIGRFNFYRFPDWVWWLFNPANHYQNRLRHSDFERLFWEADGFATTVNRRVIPRPDVEVGRLAKRFNHYSHEDLVAMNGLFTLRRASGGNFTDSSRAEPEADKRNSC